MRFWELFAAVFLFSGYCGSHLPCLWCYTELERIDRLFNEGDWLRSFPELHRLIPPVGESPCMAVPWFCVFRYSQLPAFLHTAWLGYSQQVNKDLCPWSISPALLHTDWLCWSAGSTTRTQGHCSLLSLSLASAWLRDRSQFSESDLCNGGVVWVPAGLPGCQAEKAGEGDEQEEDLFQQVCT